MGMHHDDHPDKDYEIANLVEMFDEPRAIGWKPGTEDGESHELSYTYDWTHVRAYLDFPPFPPDHLDNSLRHLAALVLD